MPSQLPATARLALALALAAGVLAAPAAAPASPGGPRVLPQGRYLIVPANEPGACLLVRERQEYELVQTAAGCLAGHRDWQLDATTGQVKLAADPSLCAQATALADYANVRVLPCSDEPRQRFDYQGERLFVGGSSEWLLCADWRAEHVRRPATCLPEDQRWLLRPAP